MAFKLVIGDRLEVPVKGEVIDGANKVPFRFTLQMRRIGMDEYRQVEESRDAVLIRDFVLDNTLGWRDQRLVLDDDNQPAAYSREALTCLLGLVGMEQTCFRAYLAELVVVGKPAGRAGN